MTPRVDADYDRSPILVGHPYALSGKLLVAAAGALPGVLLAFIALHAYNSARRRRSRDRIHLRHSLPSISSGAVHGGVAVAPSPRGLDPAVLRALTVAAAGDGAGDCAVCLAGLERGEDARTLPRSGHRFHVGCIDVWFRGNSTCLLCRADVEAPDNDAEAEVRVDVATREAAVKGGAPETRRLSIGTDLDKSSRALASVRSACF
ncbi:RING-H2 finger protein ATL2-like [Aegilops tauschii subsp. strangulata]|uniref:RING-H2 finger protein ATL2-like n=1 Tax=Aegilops tauschii subsp. strangulata TaxID=200361 RepID=UPI003CC883A2